MRLWGAWAALAWERLWPRLWPATAVIGVTLALVLLDAFTLLPPWLHAAALTAILAGTVVLLWAGLAGASWPGRSEARRRLERDSGFEHRPLTAMEDDQIAGTTDPGSRLLWNAHLLRVRSSASRWLVSLPRPNLAAQDPYAMRAWVGLLLVISIVIGGPEWGERFERNFVPAFAGTPDPTPPSLDVSVSPPDYTGEPPIYLRPERAENAPENAPPTAPPGTVSIPAGSTLLARVSAGAEQPVLAVGGERTDFDALGDDGFEIEQSIDSGSTITISQGGTTLGIWNIRVIPDLAPQIDFTEPPRGTERNALRLAYEGEDDYGIVSVSATLRLELDAASTLEREPMTLELPPPGRNARQVEGVSFHDLTAHPWAGEPVRIRLAATDNAGNTGQSAQKLVQLPEREFQHPMAQAIIDQRRTLIRDIDSADTVATNLEGLSGQLDRYDGDTVVFLSLRTAARRLIFAEHRIDEAIDPVAGLLWDTALRIEDGDLSLIERELRAAQEDLRRALVSDASDAEIEELTDRLEAALDRYLDALARDMARHTDGETAGDQDPGSISPFSSMNRSDFGDMIDAMRAMSESGARDQAQQMLSNLQDMLEALQSGSQAVEQNQAMEALNAMMDDMQSIMSNQQALFDSTHEHGDATGGEHGQPMAPGPSGDMEPFGGGPQMGPSLGGIPGQEPDSTPSSPDSGPEASPEDLSDLAGQQDQIRRDLGEMMRQMGEMMGTIPGELGAAEQSMRGSGDALTDGDADGSLGQQEQALEQLRQGAESFLNSVMDQMAGGGEGALMPGAGNGMGGAGRDPLGRPTNGSGPYADDDTDLPNADATERARAILEELRRRASDQDRPALERDYVNRLLERF